MIARKIELYLRAALGSRSWNLRGLPLLPKRLYPHSPHNRAAYNEFFLWISQILQLRQAEIVLDVGANHGDFSQAASFCFPEARIWLFEPMPTLHPVLESQAAARPAGRWQIQKTAVGAEPGRLPLFVDSTDDAIGSLVGFDAAYQRVNPQAAASRAIEVTVQTLDGFCRDNKIGQVDLLKIDVEGFEFDVLKGARETLAHTSALIIEVSLVRRAGGSSKTLLEMLERLILDGFHIVGLLPSLNGTESNGESWLPSEYNILARRSSRS